MPAWVFEGRAEVIGSGDGDELGLLADELWAARSERRLLDVDQLIERRGRDWSMDDAYSVQQMLTQRRLERGERHVGWKLGYTSLAMREQMGVDEPNFGPLTDAMFLGNGEVVPPTVAQPRVEPEIAVQLAVDLGPDPSLAEIAASVNSARACLEVVDSVWAGYRFRIEHNTADGSSAAYVVLGDQIAADDLAAVSVRFRHNGDDVAVASGAAASGDPLLGVAWLARQLASSGRGLRAGEIVITGGLTAATPLDEGDHVEAVFHGEVVVSCRR